MSSDEYNPLRENRFPVEKMYCKYASTPPYPNVVLDHVFDDDVLDKAVDCIADIPPGAYERADTPYQTHKWWLSDYRAMPEPLRNLLLWFNSSSCVDWMSEVTGIPDLIPDMTYYGGGLHVTGSGGRLGVHTDFNIHPELRLHRRVNALLFLNRGWQREWGGNLEMLGLDTGGKLVYLRDIHPLFNRLVVFNITDQSFHGMPKALACPAGVERRSLALYYYTANRPESEKAQPHMARWFVPGSDGGYEKERYVQ